MMVTGAKYIGVFLKENYTLKILNMGYNPISDVGISQIADGMQTNTSLTELNVAECGLSAKGTTCNSCNTGRSGLLNMYTVTLGPHVRQSTTTCVTNSMFHFIKVQHSTEEVHVVQFTLVFRHAQQASNIVSN